MKLIPPSPLGPLNPTQGIHRAALLQPWSTPCHQRFADRHEAGKRLADRLIQMDLKPPLLVLALPRGGVPVAVPIAQALDAPLDLLLVRKIGAPFHAELAVAAVVDGSPPELVINPETQDLPGVDAAYLREMRLIAEREIERRRAVYGCGKALWSVGDATVIVVDDGIATGTTIKAAIQALQRQQPARLIAAVPVAPHATLVELSDEVDDLVCLCEPRPFHAIGLHYDDFHQLSDEEVIEGLASVPNHQTMKT